MEFSRHSAGVKLIQTVIGGAKGNIERGGTRATGSSSIMMIFCSIVLYTTLARSPVKYSLTRSRVLASIEPALHRAKRVVDNTRAF